MTSKKRIFWALLSIIIAVLTVRTVLSQDKGFSFAEFLDFYQSANHFLLIAATFAMCGFFFFEGLAVARMANLLGYSKKRFGTIYGAADVLFSAITPSASGGQPASAYFMIRDGIPASVTTAILLVNLVMYTLSLLLVGAWSLMTHWNMFLSYSTLSQILIISGGVVMLALGGLYIMLLRHANMLYHICNGVLIFLEKIHIVRRGNMLRAKLIHMMHEFQECSDLMFGHRRLWIEAFIWNMLQRLSLVTVTVLVYLAAGYSGAVAASAWHIQNLTVLGSNCIPVPGAMGVADFLMLDGYTILLGTDELAVQMELLNRSFSFYACIITSGVIVLIGYLIRKVKKKC